MLGRVRIATMPSIRDVAWLAVMLALMALAVVFAVVYTRRIGAGRADPIVSPDWTSIEQPVSPPSGIRWGIDDRLEIEDDHVGRPFPPQQSGKPGARRLPGGDDASQAQDTAERFR
jgi:hypothetical protein